MKMRLKTVILVVMMGMLLVSCTAEGVNNEEKEKIKIAVSIVPQATFVEKVGGDLVEVVTMIPPGNNPENYQPRPRDMVAFSEAEIYFTIGVPVEQAGLLSSAKDLNTEMEFVDLADIVDSAYPYIEYSENNFYHEDDHYHDHSYDEEEDDHNHEGRDTHIWMSPKRAVVMVEAIRDNLSRIDPENAEIYEENAAAYIFQLHELDRRISETMESLEFRTFLIYHPSMGYFADDYGLNMIAIEEEGKEATAQRLKGIIDFAKENEIKAVFYQQEHDKNQAETIAREIGGEVLEIAPLSPDYIENLKNIEEAFSKVLSQEG
ncbi:metal ABC transporter solute-binding protein, Zn/Mn family [Alkalibacter saccharofermentans]|uniref:Zinc transport system substrate-binding protein n=1 Tax=Alkalibacter saccharofermentans DSM 14828 TaxID=1120975 RepID=A0A1M4XWN8_9FIRM|nr:zinc ABC transporter substrate-binding protein [Alkalibacter saccharofermentans]SHE97889.1 zinc transport system substrate-binding protein [Alkalibacter saccharofermentans DSM 14828]